ncbi:hypothetical protein GCM10022420_024860 [Streptomyces iranensis]|uniref:Uncharacterized protein n=1 Tax=Streptomyces iranensis TaxID=576784 RepID=A0A060ZRW3_9ACTN|nr:predicted protein [Streptomyces iranensis]
MQRQADGAVSRASEFWELSREPPSELGAAELGSAQPPALVVINFPDPHAFSHVIILVALFRTNRFLVRFWCL